MRKHFNGFGLPGKQWVLVALNVSEPRFGLDGATSGSNARGSADQGPPRPPLDPAYSNNVVGLVDP